MFLLADTEVCSRRTLHPAEATQTRSRAAPSRQEEQQPGPAACWRGRPPVQPPLVAERRTAAAQVRMMACLLILCNFTGSSCERVKTASGDKFSDGENKTICRRHERRRALRQDRSTEFSPLVVNPALTLGVEP